MARGGGKPQPTITDDRALGAVDIQRSLRIDQGTTDLNGANYSRTFGSGDRKTFTISLWVKKCNTPGNIGDGDDQYSMLSAGGGGSGASAGNFFFYNDDTLRFTSNPQPSTILQLITNRRFRDVDAWYHVMAVLDTTQATESNRAKIYVNGVQETSFSTATYPSQNNTTVYLNGAFNHRVGSNSLGSDLTASYGNFNGYFAEYNFIDGQALEPSSFGFTDPQTGMWMPKRYEGTYGTNGFYLDFSDNTSTTTLGIDKSPNGNDFAPEDVRLSDSVTDTPTNNFCTLNSLNCIVNSNNYAAKLREGNLLMVGGDVHAASTFNLPKSGKWYAEFSKYGNGAPQAISVTRANRVMTSYDGALGLADHVQYVSNGEVGNRTRGSTSDATTWQDDADIVVAMAVDMDNGAVYFARANTWINSGVPTSGSAKTGAIATDLLTDNGGDHYIGVQGYNGSNSYGMYANFGQQPFTYTPPAGYKTLCTKNLPKNVPAIRPKKHFDVLTWTGNATARTITGLEFKPDLVWVKCRTNGHDHQFTDSVRGSQYALRANEQNAEDDWGSGGMGSYVDGGFILNDTSNGRYNENSQDFVAWCWKAGGSSNTYNIDGTGYATAAAAGLDGGTIDPTGASINTESGFSIVTYTANGTNGATIAHGLGKKPAWIIIKCRSNADNWMVYHQQSNEGSSPEDFYLELNTTASTTDSPNMLNDTAPTDTLITLNNDGSVNSGSRTYVMYCWAEIPGFSKFGEYRAQDSSYRGPYIHTGFKPAWVMSKGLSLSWQDWCIFDDKRKTLSGSGNRIDGKLGANQEIVEAKDDYNVVDFLANGWRVTGQSGSDINYGSGYPKQLYMAFAEEPGTTPFDTFPNAR